MNGVWIGAIHQRETMIMVVEQALPLINKVD